MLALAIEFSRCSRARTLKAEQCARRQACAGGGQCHRPGVSPTTEHGTDVHAHGGCQRLLRKEVIQPHLPVRLPCYDFTPIASPTFDGSLPKGWATGFGCCPLSWCDGRCVQGPGTYSPQHC